MTDDPKTPEELALSDLLHRSYGGTEPSADLRSRLAAAGRVAADPDSVETASRQRAPARRPAWLVPVLVAAMVAALVVGVSLWLPRNTDPAPAAPVPVSTAEATAVETVAEPTTPSTGGRPTYFALPADPAPTDPDGALVRSDNPNDFYSLTFRDGCVHVSLSGTQPLAVFPAGYRARADGAWVEVVDAQGRAVLNSDDLLTGSSSATPRRTGPADSTDPCLPPGALALLIRPPDASEAAASRTPGAGLLVALPTSDWTPGDFAAWASLSGVLVWQNGCLFVDTGAALTLPVWPAGFSGNLLNGTLEVIDPDGHQVAASGQQVDLAGGSTRPTGANRPECLAQGDTAFEVNGDVTGITPTGLTGSVEPAVTTSDSSGHISLPTSAWTIGDPATEGHLDGQLTWDGSCLTVGEVHPLWPAGYFARERQGVIELLDETGSLIATVGDLVSFNGGSREQGSGEPCQPSGAPIFVIQSRLVPSMPEGASTR